MLNEETKEAVDGMAELFQASQGGAGEAGDEKTQDTAAEEEGDVFKFDSSANDNPFTRSALSHGKLPQDSTQVMREAGKAGRDTARAAASKLKRKELQRQRRQGRGVKN